MPQIIKEKQIELFYHKLNFLFLAKNLLKWATMSYYEKLNTISNLRLFNQYMYKCMYKLNSTEFCALPTTIFSAKLKKIVIFFYEYVFEI